MATTPAELVPSADSPRHQARICQSAPCGCGDGEQISLIYLNGKHKLAEFPATSVVYAKGGIGFIASNARLINNHIHYDKLKVYH